MTLSSTLLGFAFGTALGVAIAVGIVHVTALDRSLMPWIIASQTIPILAIAPMVIVVFAAIGITGIIPKSMISTYLSFFPVAVGMVKRAALAGADASRPDAHLQRQRLADILEAARACLRAVPVCLDEGGGGGEPRRRDRRRTAEPARSPASAPSCSPASYYSQTIDMWSALVAGSIVAALLVTVVGLAGPVRRPLDGSEAGMSRFRPSWQALAALGAGPRRDRAWPD